MNNWIFVCCIFLFLNAQAQQNVILKGKIISNSKTISNVHIYNISKSIGTISNDIGLFEIKVALNDTLYVSTLQYKKATFIVTQQNIKLQQLIFELIPSVNELDEVFLRHLTGDLFLDIANKPKDTIPIIGYVYNKKDLLKNNYNGQTDANDRADPQMITDPLGPSGFKFTSPYSNYLQRLKRELNQKRKFPDLLKHDLGIKYFIVNLNIPEEKIYNFIAYCEYRDIIKKYHNNKQLEVIEILKHESKKYNAIKN